MQTIKFTRDYGRYKAGDEVTIEETAARPFIGGGYAEDMADPDFRTDEQKRKEVDRSQKEFLAKQKKQMEASPENKTAEAKEDALNKLGHKISGRKKPSNVG